MNREPVVSPAPPSGQRVEMNRTLWSLALVFVMIAVPASAAVTVVVTPVVAPSFAFLQSGPHHPNVTATNWAGYAVTGPTNSVKFVKGSWIQPKVTCPTTGNRWSSFWVGIDGYSSTTVEQTGTEADCSGGVASYSAWYEFYPAFPVTLSMTVSSGDTMLASVSYINATVGFTTLIKDVTTGVSHTHSQKVAGAKRTSAEWIAEAPYSGGVLPLSNFGKAQFGTDATGVTHSNVATISGTTGAIGSFTSSTIEKINMINNAHTHLKAATSPLTPDGTSFNVTWKSVGP